MTSIQDSSASVAIISLYIFFILFNGGWGCIALKEALQDSFNKTVGVARLKFCQVTEDHFAEEQSRELQLRIYDSTAFFENCPAVHNFSFSSPHPPNIGLDEAWKRFSVKSNVNMQHKVLHSYEAFALESDIRTWLGMDLQWGNAIKEWRSEAVTFHTNLL